MIPVVSRAQIRALDRHAIETCRVPSIVLMENAGRGASDVVERCLGDGSRGRVVVVCGPGNNGGDGFVVARRLSVLGRTVRVLFASTRARLSGDALLNHDAYVGIGGQVVPIDEANLDALSSELSGAALVVDGLLGTGLDREVTGFFRAVIERINAAGRRVVALDIPSGLDADTGRPLGVAVRADETVTFAHSKLGLVTSVGAEHAGRVSVVDIGVPAGLVTAVGTSAAVLEERDVAAWLRPRTVSVHKGSAGRVVAVAGSPGKSGAALLVARGALRAGAGLVTICTSPDAADAIDRRVLEEMTGRIDPASPEGSLDRLLEGAGAVVVGPGVGLDPRARRIVDHVVLGHPGPVVVDADALTHFAGRLAELERAPGPRILTPHPVEMARVLGIGTSDVEGNRFDAVRRAVSLSGAVVLLKGARTLVGAPGQATVVNPSGNPALATAGSGDVLSGITGALVIALEDAFRAACAAAFVHGRAGDEWAVKTGADRGLLAHEIADAVPPVLARLTPVRGPLPV